jgi:hypothetical protein
VYNATMHPEHSPNEIENIVQTAVADAMVYAYSKYITEQYTNEKRDEKDPETSTEGLTMTEIATDATERKCADASGKALYFLWDRYNTYFDEMMILTSRSTSDIITEDHQFKQDRERWMGHSVAVAKGIDGKYYAFSPANYDSGHAKKGFDESLLTSVYEATDLQELVDQIQGAEGGLWPTEEQIRGLLPEKSKPEIVDKDITTNLKQNAKGKFVVEVTPTENDKNTAALTGKYLKINAVVRKFRDYSKLEMEPRVQEVAVVMEKE